MGTAHNDNSERIRILVRICLPLLVFVGVAYEWLQVLRLPFDAERLIVKSLVPFAVLLPAAAFRTRSGLLSSTLPATTIALASALACLSVFGVPLQLDVLLPLLGVMQPGSSLWIAAAVALTLGLSYRLARSSTVRGALATALSALGESLYFWGFLYLATAHLGPLAPAIVATGQFMAAWARGVPVVRALIGTGLVGVVAFASESSLLVMAAHLAALSSAEGASGGPAEAGALPPSI